MTAPEPPTPPRTPAQSPASTRPRHDEKAEGGSNLGRLKSWASENSIAVTGWLVAFISMLVAIVALLPGFRGERLSEKAPELAEWTALKDYIEQCKEEVLGGAGSTDCQEVVTMPLPPPPHVQTHAINQVKRFMFSRLDNHLPNLIHSTRSSDLTPAALLLVVFLTLLLAAVFLFASFECNRKSLHSQTKELTDGEAMVETWDVDLAPLLHQRTGPEQVQLMKTPCTGSELGHFRAHIEVDSEREFGHFIFHESVLFSEPYKNWSLEELRFADYEYGFRLSQEHPNRPQITPLPSSLDALFRPYIESTTRLVEELAFQGIFFEKPYVDWSSEELRLEDYGEGLRFGSGIHDAFACTAIRESVSLELDMPNVEGFKSPPLEIDFDSFDISTNPFQSHATKSWFDGSYSSSALVKFTENQEIHDRSTRRKLKEDVAPIMRLACPYYKRDPETYKNHRSCCGPGWPEIYRVKEHLYRRHRLFDCSRCGKCFKSERELEDHYRELVPCPILTEMNSDPNYGLKKETEKKLKMRRINNSSDAEQWASMYRLLFELDETADVPSPYYTSMSRKDD